MARRPRRRLAESPLVTVAGCCTAHAALALALPDPWLAPNLTLVGLVLAVTEAPARWAALSAAAAGCATVWAIRFPAAVAAAHLAAGWGIRWVAAQWDASDERVQGLLVLLTTSVLTLGMLWVQDLWSLPVTGLAAAHLGLTYAAFLVIRRLAGPAQVVG